MENIYKQVADDRYEIIMKRNQKFRNEMSDMDVIPTKVFDPLSPKHLEELNLIRNVSVFLQKKKGEDINKAAAAQAAAQETEQTKVEEAKELEKEDS